MRTLTSGPNSSRSLRGHACSSLLLLSSSLRRNGWLKRCWRMKHPRRADADFAVRCKIGEMTAADRQLIEYAARHGFVVTARQLKRWRDYGVLPRRMRLHLGRGRGTSSQDPRESGDQLIALCRRLEVDRRLSRAAVWLWYEEWAFLRGSFATRSSTCTKLPSTTYSVGPSQSELHSTLPVLRSAVHPWTCARRNICTPSDAGRAQTYEGCDQRHSQGPHRRGPEAGRTRPRHTNDLILSGLTGRGHVDVEEDLLVHS